MSKIKDKWDGFDKWTKRFLGVVTVLSILSASISACWAGFNYFAPRHALEEFISNEFEPLEKSYNDDKAWALLTAIEDRMARYRRDYGEDLERASDDVKREYREMERQRLRLMRQLGLIK